MHANTILNSLKGELDSLITIFVF